MEFDPSAYKILYYGDTERAKSKRSFKCKYCGTIFEAIAGSGFRLSIYGSLINDDFRVKANTICPECGLELWEYIRD